MQAQIDERQVLARFESRTRRSAEMYRRALDVTPGGVMGGIKYFEPYPVFMERGKGAHLWDVDGNRYVDYLMSYGALILGHGPEAVRRAISKVLQNVGTTVTGTPTEQESEYGGMLRDIYHGDGAVRFTNSGLEATLLAARLARGYTRRRKVAKFEGHYHGAVDHFLFSYMPEVSRAGSGDAPSALGDSVDVDESALSDSIVLPFNNWGGTERILIERSREIGCVIMEPFEEGVIPAERSFISNLRKLTADLKVPLIFDEVKTGFRVRFGGATEFYGVTPDVTCLGKIIGGGLPIGAVVGDLDIMKQLDPRKENRRKVFHSGTFNGNPLSLAAGRATVEELGRRGRFEGLRKRTEKLRRSISKELTRHGLRHVMEGEGAMFNFYLTEKKVRDYRAVQSSDLRLRRLIDIGLISHGIYLKPQGRYSISLAHTDSDIESTGDRFGDSLESLLQKSPR